jgi:hypothetical protein
MEKYYCQGFFFLFLLNSRETQSSNMELGEYNNACFKEHKVG